MTQTVDYPMSIDFSAVSSLQANGQSGTGSALPSGIPGYLDIIGGVMRSKITQNDTPTFSGIRSEILMPVEPAAPNEAWFYWEFMLPSAEFVPLNDPISLMQIHAADDLGVIANPFVLQYNIDGSLTPQIPLTEPPTAGTSTKAPGGIRAIFDHWYRAVLRVGWATDKTGSMSFYLDGKPVFRNANIGTTYTDASAGYFKLGAYDATHNARFGTNCVVYYRNIKRWSGNAGYVTVMGTGLNPIPSTLLLSVN